MDKKMVILTGIVIVTFIGFLAFVFINRSFSESAQASASSSVSTTNSLIFAWPLSLPASAQSKSEVTLFIRSAQGRGVSGRQVRITSSLGTVAEGSLTTDEEGKAIFHVTSQTPGVAKIEAFVDNIKLQKTVSVKFE